MAVVIERKTWRDAPPCTLEDIEFDAANLDPAAAAAAYQTWGALVVRGLNAAYAPAIHADLMALVDEGIRQLDQAEPCSAGWTTPNGVLWLPAPKGYARDKQVMTVPLSYTTSGTFLASALNPKQLDVVEAILGPHVELFLNGQALCKEPVGGHPKNLHQDETYFFHKYAGPVAILSYAQDTTEEMGALHVVPGSHAIGSLPHTDTFSHLGLAEEDWPWEKSLCIPGRAGDAIFFALRTIHGSKENHSNTRRGVFIHRYRHVDDFVIAGGHTTEQIQAALAKADSKVKSKQEHGLMVRGQRVSSR